MIGDKLIQSAPHWRCRACPEEHSGKGPRSHRVM